MERVFRRRPFVAAVLVAAMAAEPMISRGQTSQPDQLRQELEAMKKQLRQVQEQMKKRSSRSSRRSSTG
jgi:predicted ATP-grasp superfamily ATP-dependent carboligase